MRMPFIAIGTGVLLIIVGSLSANLSGTSSFTAYIPSFIGVVFAVLGGVALKPSLTKHAMHGAAALSVLAILGSLDGIGPFFGVVFGRAVERPAAAVAKVVMLIVCVAFLVLAVRSFIEARRNRQQQSESPA
jgi:hypothetical protein